MSSGSRVILGIDPGIALLGFGVIRAEGDTMHHIEHGCIATSPAQSLPERLSLLYEELRAVKQRSGATDVAVESLFFSRNVTTAVAVGQARGVALLATVDRATSFGEYTPSEAVTPGGIVPRAAAMELRTTQVDGMDVLAVRAAAAEIVERVRGGGGAERLHRAG